MIAKRRRTRDRLAALPGVRPVRRPLTPTGDEQFDLYYVRAGLKSAHPIVIIPGGPGVASVAPYRGFRRRATATGLDVIMIEHRGIGLSRHRDCGADLPAEGITVEQVVDDVVAVLDDAGVTSAIIYGSSYGTYIAAGVGVRHPDRVVAMVLDSPVLSSGDIVAMRAAVRALLWEDAPPHPVGLASRARRLVDGGVLAGPAAQVATLMYEYGGTVLLERQLNLLLRGRTWVWRGLTGVRRLAQRQVPYRHEDDLVGRIAFRELDFAGTPDGGPLDPSVTIRQMYGCIPEFEGEPFDLIAELPRFHWPTVVLSGGRDLTTPPAVARRVAGLIPDAALVELVTAGHSMLDTRERAALAVMDAVRAGAVDALAARSRELDALPAKALLRAAVSVVSAATVLESVLPNGVRRLVSKAYGFMKPIAA